MTIYTYLVSTRDNEGLICRPTLYIHESKIEYRAVLFWFEGCLTITAKCPVLSEMSQLVEVLSPANCSANKGCGVSKVPCFLNLIFVVPTLKII